MTFSVVEISHDETEILTQNLYFSDNNTFISHTKITITIHFTESVFQNLISMNCHSENTSKLFNN